MTNKFEILKTGFFGWNNFKKGFTEIIKMVSNKESLFSLKRFQTIIALFIFIEGAVYTLFTYVNSVESFLIWSGPVLVIGGFSMVHTQKEKTELLNKEQ